MRYAILLFLILLALSLSAQVGVNNTTPEQALDINGKIKLTDDADGDVEGYNGSGRAAAYVCTTILTPRKPPSTSAYAASSSTT